MYKIPFFTIVYMITVIILLTAIGIPSLARIIFYTVISSLPGAIYIILITILFIALLSCVYFDIRTIRYLYLIYSCDFRIIKTTENGLILQTHNKDILLHYTNIKSITMQEIEFDYAFSIDKIIIETDNLSMSGFISSQNDFNSRIPYYTNHKKLKVKNYYKW